MDKTAKFQEKKRIILEALKRCLARDVYSNITVQDVADESNFSKGGLLHYFPTKEEMYTDLMNSLFSEIEDGHVRVLEGNLKSVEKASISALYGIERFVLDKNTIKILLNLILYGYEDEKIMQHIRAFIRKHLELYVSLIEEARPDNPHRRKTDFDSQFIARLAQTLVLSAGLLESIDPINLDAQKLIRYIIALFKG